VIQTAYTSGAQLTTLTQGTAYWVAITAVPPAGYAPATSATSASSAAATTQLVTPLITGTGTGSGPTHGVLTITYTGSSNAPGGQTYTAYACTDAAMTQSCVTTTNYISGANITGMTRFANYYVTITATSSTGYLAATSAVGGPQNIR